ncbi:hypothetical protein D3C83_253130 [compost metagenome]
MESLRSARSCVAMGSGRMVAMVECRMTSSSVLTEFTSITTLGVICALAKNSSMHVRVM